MQVLLRKIRQILRDRRTRRLFTRAVSSVGAIVVFVTTYALILPAITLEKTAVCGIEAHQHSDSCYEERLVCGQGESDGHHHDDSCYSITTELSCGIQEHRHSAENGCYDADGNLVCGLQEHFHDDSCYEEIRTLTCGLKESDGHHHTHACYEKVLVCGKEVHIHSEKCYEKGSSTDASAEYNAGDTVPGASNSNASTDSNTGDPVLDSSDANTASEEAQSDSCVPELDPLNMDAMFNSHTDFYYYHTEEGKEVPADSTEITDWRKVGEETGLVSTDLVKLYLAYTIPAGSLDETNSSARYRLPSNIHLSDKQIEAMNRYENGVAAGYRDSGAVSDVSDVSDKDEKDKEKEKYQKYLGAEAIEGDRTPDEILKDGEQEYISAVVRAENVYDHDGQYLGQDLIFTFVPYSIDKNRNIYNEEKTLISAGKKITGWFACDLRLDQIDWEAKEDSDEKGNIVETIAEEDSEESTANTARVIFVQADQKQDIKEISRVLKMTGKISDGEYTREQNERIFKSGTLTAEGDDYSITLDYSEEAKIPEYAFLSVREITAETDKEAYEACLAQASQEVSADDQSAVDRTATRFFDIEIVVTEKNSDGTEKNVKIEPSAPVNVHIQVSDKHESTGSKTDQSEPTVLHFAEEGVEQIDSTVTDSQNNNAEEQKTEIRFEAESFSVYGVVYTVDFHWEVNGKMYDFSIPGGGFVSLEHLVQALGIVGNASNTETTDKNAQTPGDVVVSDAVKEFVADVESVEFSSPDLVWVGKAADASTVGQLKEANGLNCQYSAELGQEQIEQINASTVEAGDWALISLRPFISAETLTVTMKDGEVFTVQVTDARISTSFLSDNGYLYKVVVTYGEDAKIPENAVLKVTPYNEYSNEFDLIRDIVYADQDQDPTTVLQTLDISIIGADGQKIEPAAPVRVDLTMKGKAEELESAADLFTVMHLDESSGSIHVETVADTTEIGNIHPEGSAAAATFTLDSFSQFAITYGNYVKVNVHYVDVNGNELNANQRDFTVGTNGEVQLESYKNKLTQQNYTYLSAHYGTYSGQVITSLKATQNPTEGSLTSTGRSITFYNGGEIVARQEYDQSLRQVDVYLVYARSSGYYILDTIGEDGCLTVQNGTSVIETGVDQNLFVRWYRSSNSATGFQEVTQSKMLNGNYNIPELDGPKVNVSIDEGADQYYKAVIYKVEDNQEIVLAATDPYHVPYYDDVRNGGFETPHNNGTTDESVNRWPSNWQVENGQYGVVWKTTGLANDGTNRDIEIPQGPDSNGQGANNLGETLRNYCFAFMPEGNQCAELNCEASGALYQDVLTIPGSQLYWSLYHRARGAYDYWKTKTDKTQNSETDTMYVVAMPKELAEKYDVTTQAKVLSILDHVNDPNSEFHDIEIVRITTTNKGNGTIEFMNSGSTLTVPPTYFGNLPNGGTATVYDSGTRLTFKYGNTDWHYYTGNFSIPENQYLTRFFFVAGNTASNNPTMGNFLDCISMSDSVPTPNHGQATVIIKKTVEGLDTLPQDYATRIETKYQTKKSNSVTTTTEKDSDFDSYRSQIDGQSGKLVSIASWTYPISIDNGDSIVFTKSEETAPENNAKTDTVIGYTQTTAYMIRKQSSGQSDPGVIARGSGKIIPAEEIQRLTVEEKDIIYIEYINTYVPKKTSVTLEKVDRADLDNEDPDLLKGAAFILSKYNSEEFREKDDTWGTNGSKELKDTKNPDGTYTLNGSFTFEDLPIGFYQIEETAFPNGYIQLNSNPTFKIEVNASNELFITLINNPDNLLRLVDGQLTIVVGNIPGAALPNTGGPGTTLIYLLGIMLAGIAGAVLVMRKCRRKA